MNKRNALEISYSRWSLPIVYSVVVLARTSVIAVIPVLAYKYLGKASFVSILYFAASFFGLAVSFFLPKLIMVINPWRALIVAACAGALSASLFLYSSIVILLPGLLLHLLMVSMFESIINIYTVRTIHRRDLSEFETRRVFLAGVTYVLGPLVGVWSISIAGTWTPLIISACCSIAVPIILIALIPSARNIETTHMPGLPSHNDVFLFWSQPRLRLAWVLAIVRAWWWQVYMVYTPIYAVNAGYGFTAGGIIIATGSGMLLLAPFWQIVSRKYGLRQTFFYGYMICGLATALSGIVAYSYSAASIVLLMVAALAISAIDSRGNSPFLRAVRAHQRIRMIPIYNTYRDIAQIAPSALFAIILLLYGINSVFLITGLILVAVSQYCLYLNRRL